MAFSAATVASAPLCARPAARRSVVCAAQKQEQKPVAQKAAQVAAAGLAALFIAAAPSMAAESNVKQRICASNPTSKICLRDSAKN